MKGLAISILVPIILFYMVHRSERNKTSCDNFDKYFED